MLNSSAILSVNKSIALGLVRLLRPRQWIKSAFVLIPLLFSTRLTDPMALLDALWAAVWFSLTASIGYIINDYHDIEYDRKHTTKAYQRPLASGQVSKAQSLVLLLVLALFVIWGAGQQVA